MQVALMTTFAVTKKAALSVLLERIHAAFRASGLGEPSILFTFSDAPVPGAFSTVDRLLNKYPDFARFTGERSVVPNTPPIRQVSNRLDSVGAGESAPFSTLLAVAAGVPKSLPFHAPPLPERVAAVIAACGKIKNTVQVPSRARRASGASAIRAAVARGRQGGH